LLPFSPEPSIFSSAVEKLKIRMYRIILNRVLRRIFGPRSDEVTGGWRKLHNEELRDFYSSPSLIRLIKSRWMRWAGHLARIVKEKRNAYSSLVEMPEGKGPLGRPNVGWWIILR
jgi:hypothetical protein